MLASGLSSFTIDLDARKLVEDGRPVHLRNKAFDLLAVLVRNEGRLLSHQELYKAVWGERHVSGSLLKGCVRDLRRVLRDDPRRPRHIEAVVGHGYRYLGGLCIARCPAAHWTETLPSIAVLPVVIMSTVFDAAVLGSVATEIISSELEHNGRLHSVHTGHMLGSEWQKHRPQTLGRYLGAHALVVGYLADAGSRLRLDLRLLDTLHGRCLWGDRFILSDRNQSGTRRAARMAAGRIADCLRGQTLAKALATPRAAMQPYDHVLIGEHRPAVSGDANGQARDDYLAAIRLDPTCAPGWAGLAHSHAIDALFGYSSDYQGSMDAALAAAVEARAWGPRDAKAAWVLGHVLSLRGESAAALHAFGHVQKLAPIDTDALVMKGMALQFSGLPQEALRHHRRALRLTPNPPGWYLWNTASAAFQCRNYEQSIELLEPFVAERPGFLRPRYNLAAAYAMQGRQAAAEQVLAPVIALDPNASLRHEIEQADMIGIPAGQTDLWLEGLSRAGLRS